MCTPEPPAGDLTRADLTFVLESLSFTRRAFENHDYPSYVLRKARLAEVEAVAAKVRALRNSLPQTSNGQASPAP